MYPAFTLAVTAMPAWRILLALLLAGVLGSGVLLSLWVAGAQARLKLAILLALLTIALVLLAAVWLTRRSLPVEQVEAEPATTGIWLVENCAGAGFSPAAEQGVLPWTG